MVGHYVKRLLVVDASHKLLGIVSRVDILRALAQPGLAEMPRPSLPPGSPEQVGQIMLKQVPTVLTNVSLAEVVHLLVTYARRRVVVIDGARHVVGIITDGDLMNRATEKERGGILQSLTRRLFLAGEATFHLNYRTAAEVMTAPVITVTPTTPLREALRLLLHHGIKRLPVVNEQGQLVGLIGRADILQALALHQ
jgi:CBS domain-containing protein